MRTITDGSEKMSNLNDRERAFENKFAHDEELKFRAYARRNKLVGLWAAEKLGKTGDDADAYAKEVVLADFEEAGDDDVFRKLLRDLRRGEYDVLVGINLLREGLDLPEVSLVAILDADKEGFLRSTRSLIQTIGRAARNANGEVFLYADRITASMRTAIDETARRRALQSAHNAAHGITPKTIRKAVFDLDPSSGASDYVVVPILKKGEALGSDRIPERIEELRSEMLLAAEQLEFERAATLRDRIARLEAALRDGKAARRANR